MKTVFNNFKNGNPYLLDLPVPECGDQEVIIRNHYSLISSGTEKFLIDFSKSSFYKKILNNKDRVKTVIKKINEEGFQSTLRKVENKLNYPFRLGYSSAGTVISKGKNVRKFKIGDSVISNSFHSEISVCTENLCALIPKDVTFKEAIFCVPGSIALHSIRLAKPTIGENFVVIGLGLIGQLTLQILQANGCNVVGVDINKKKIDIAKANKNRAYNFNTNINKKIIKFFNQESIDGLIFTSSVNQKTIDYYSEICRKKARVIIVGTGQTQFSRDLFYKKELSITVSCSYGPGRYDSKYENQNYDYPIEYVRWTENRNFKSFLNLISKKKIKTSNLLTNIYSLNKIEKAYEDLFNDNTIALALKYDNQVKLTKTINNTSIKNLKHNKIGKIKISFIGSGNYTSNTLLPLLQKRSNVYLDMIYSPTGVSSTILSMKNSFKSSTTNINDLLKKKDTVFITTNHESHGKIFNKALNEKLNIYIEKPLSTSLSELNKIEKKLNSNISKVYYLGFNRRFSSLNKEISKHIEDKGPIFINYNINATTTDINHWTSDENNGGRLVGEICHFVDYCSFIIKSEIVSWSCSHQNSLNDNISISLSYSNGSRANINYITYGCDNYPKENIYFFFEKKMIHLVDFKKLYFYGFSFFKKTKTLISQDKGQKNMIEKFLYDIENNIFDSFNIRKVIYENKLLLEIKNEILK